MSTPMALGPFAFTALHGLSYKTVGRELDAGWATVPVAQRLDSLQWTGPKQERITIGGVLFPEEFGGLSQLEGLRDMAASGVAMPLVSLGGEIHGFYALEKVGEDRDFHDGMGMPRRDAYRLELRRVDDLAGGGTFMGLDALIGLF